MIKALKIFFLTLITYIAATAYIPTSFVQEELRCEAIEDFRFKRQRSPQWQKEMIDFKLVSNRSYIGIERLSFYYDSSHDEDYANLDLPLRHYIEISSSSEWTYEKVKSNLSVRLIFGISPQIRVEEFHGLKFDYSSDRERGRISYTLIDDETQELETIFMGWFTTDCWQKLETYRDLRFPHLIMETKSWPSNLPIIKEINCDYQPDAKYDRKCTQYYVDRYRKFVSHRNNQQPNNP